MPFCQIGTAQPSGDTKKMNKALFNEKLLRRRVGIFWNFHFQNFDRRVNISEKYKKTAILTKKDEKKQNNDKDCEKRSHKRREIRSLLSWQQHTIRLLAVDISGEGSFSGEGIFHGTLPCHKLEEIRTLSQEDYGSGGLVPQRLFYVKGLYNNTTKYLSYPSNDYNTTQ